MLRVQLQPETDFVSTKRCWCGSMAEQLICNQQVDGSTPFTSSRSGVTGTVAPDDTTEYHVGIPERPKGADCKSVVTDFGGPNPPAPTKNPECVSVRDFYFLPLHYSLFTHPHIRDFWQVISNSE